MTAALPTVAAWDIPLLRAALASLTTVCGRLPSWRFRIEAAGRSIAAGQYWSGPAGTGAAAAVVELSTVVTAVGRGLDRSLVAFEHLAHEAAIGQQLATEELVRGTGSPAGAAAEDRPGMSAVLRRAAAVAAAAAEAGEPLRALGVADAFVPESFPDLARLVGTDAAAVPPPAAPDPDAVARWWASLSESERAASLVAEPARLGRLDGIPGWARDRANRLVLDRAMTRRDLGGPVTWAVAQQLSEAAAAGLSVQLLTFDPAAGLVALAFGDIDAADAVALLVPGILTTAATDLPALDRDAEAVASAARAAAPGLAVAAVAWLGYRTPQHLPEILTRGDARRGGRALDATLDGLAAARAATNELPARTTVVAHSYGTVVVDEAADRPGRLAADAVVLLGSPGMQVDGAVPLEAPEVYDAAAALDPVSWVGWFGEDTWAPAYGATELPADWDTLHWQYYDQDRPTLAALGRVVAGSRLPR